MATATGRFAVVLNRNAKKVNEQVEEISGELVPPEDLFLSSSPEDSKTIADTIIARGYETVFAGGGDGTVMHLVNSIAHCPLEQQPIIGILKLGTGNAMARMVSSGNLAADLRTYQSSATRDVIPISLIEAEKIRCPFSGIGLDAEILNDFKETKAAYGDGFMKPVVQNLGGYFVGVFTRTVPRKASRTLKGAFPHVKATVLKGECTRLGPEGKPGETFGPGDVIFDGPFTIANAGTIPFYGYGFKILPYARMDPNRFHLRIGHMGTVKVFANLSRIWTGEYHGDDLHDWLVEEVLLEASESVPLQIGGDAAGLRPSVSFKIVPNCVRLLRLL
jgi:diacylglycerol kinase family enzyme